ncbi:hypothetical protein KI387_040757, partial [Taxus chinensis]
KFYATRDVSWRQKIKIPFKKLESMPVMDDVSAQVRRTGTSLPQTIRRTREMLQGGMVEGPIIHATPLQVVPTSISRSKGKEKMMESTPRKPKEGSFSETSREIQTPETGL